MSSDKLAEALRLGIEYARGELAEKRAADGYTTNQYGFLERADGE